jgi:hypothetical protein
MQFVPRSALLSSFRKKREEIARLPDGVQTASISEITSVDQAFVHGFNSTILHHLTCMYFPPLQFNPVKGLPEGFLYQCCSK